MAKPNPSYNHHSTLEAALVGYQLQLKQIDEQVAAIQSRLGVRGRRTTTARTANPSPAAVATPKKKRHKLSAEGRARIAAAQRARWAASRKGAKVRTAGGGEG